MHDYQKIRFIFAGDRYLSVQILDFILMQNLRPLALMVSNNKLSKNSNDLINKCSFLEEDKIYHGKQFKSIEVIEKIRDLNPDFIFCIHFPYIIPKEILEIPKIGTLNLHPAYLPYNRGWHTPTWAILENTPIGATLHFMDEGIDTGDIVYQKQIDVSPADTAHSLYQKLLKLEIEVFKESWPNILNMNIQRKSQKNQKGTYHKKQDLFKENIQKIDLNEKVVTGELLQKLRALTTNDINEAAYIYINNIKYCIQLQIEEKRK